MNFTVSALTDIGTKKTVNQDCLFVRSIETGTGNIVLAVLCDGMGGLSKGEVASASIIQAFSDWMNNSLPALSRMPLEDHIIREQWTEIIVEQNRRIREYGNKNNCKVGSTVVALLLTEYRYYLLNIGDTRAYLINDRLQQLTSDHTLAANEIRLGNITPEQAENSPIEGILTRCVGVAETVHPDMFFGATQRDAVYMLCSDGFRHNISNSELAEHFSIGNFSDDTDIKRKEEWLIELNKQRGETDNISVITICSRGSDGFKILNDITCMSTDEKIE